MTEYVFPEWFNSKDYGVAFIYIFNTCIQTSVESKEEVDELLDFYKDFPLEEPNDTIDVFKKKLLYIVHIMLLSDGFDITITSLHDAFDKVLEYTGE